MKIWAFTMAYNEAELIAYWVRHYKQFCEKVIVNVDVDSTDDTEYLARSEGADVRPWIGQGLDDPEFSHFASQQCKEAELVADWVIWTDADELLYHRNICQKLADLDTAGVNMPYIQYWVMASKGLPTHQGQIYDADDFRKGLFVSDDGKLAAFNPKNLSIRWGVGKHHADAVTGQANRGEKDTDSLKILHYRWLGEDYYRRRNAKNYARLTPMQRAQGTMGFHVKPDFIGPYDEGWPGPYIQDAQTIL